MTITWKRSIILQNIWLKAMDSVFINVSTWNILPSILSPERFHQNGQAAFSLCEYWGVKARMKKRTDMLREINNYICAIVKSWTHARSHRFGISVMSRGNKDESGLSYRVHYRETWSPPTAGHAQSTNFGILVDTDWG